ncbi:hypothetical protein BCIN_15g03990 [Botrytis cinerea B05.10]|uniref:Tat pathway signal sequence protein n=1 Tax=Botryotinia fuckeliana (strain B05.10) TaxID=332648 RepID=A0A384K501_BOTFB|nr:hypothetical protein BCIN_15g03990 [Botrytis cinerea B05.10]ATZ57878.1 hypothetical protein BCIN_15g03990 [Botrytis cinerea B05.10]
MSSLMMWNKSHDYDLTDQEDGDLEVKTLKSSSHRARIHFLLRILCFMAVAFAWTYFVGSNSYHAGVHRIATEYQKLNIDVDMVHHTFHYDDSFPKPPTSSRIHSDYPWADLYPQHGPYFNKSATNPERWTFSVFHQLHCVNRLRHGYWKAHTAAMEGKSLEDEDKDRLTSPEHIQHCLDYLRQSLMCHGDTTLEPDDVGINGAHGFGIQHNCKSWNQLLHETDKRVLNPYE